VSLLLNLLFLALVPLLPLYTWVFMHVPTRVVIALPGLAVASAALLLVLALAYDSFTGRAPGHVPSPPSPLPFLGQSKELHGYRHRALEWLTMYSRRFGGKTWTFKVMFRPRVYVILSPENVEYILKTNFANYGKGPMFRARMEELLGEGIFNVDGSRWYEQRKISSHLFTHRNFKQRMLTTINKDVHTLVDIVGQVADKAKGNSSGAAEVNFSRLFARYTLDAIGEIAFGKDIGALRGESADFVTSFDYIQSFLNDLVLKPPGYAFYCRHFTPEGKRYAQCLDTLNTYVRRMVATAKDETTPEELAARGDMLALFMTRTDSDGKPFSVEYLRDIVVNMTIAGRDTTAYALAWTLWLLANHPDVQAKARTEAQAAYVKAKDQGTDLSYEAIDSLAYLDAVFTEVLRLYPSVPKNPKCVCRDDVLPDGTPVRAGSYVMYIPYVMARLPELWGPDPEKFDPERHLQGRHRPSPYLWPAFQAGPRTCLGQKLAYMEAKAVLCALLANFEFARSPSVAAPRLVQNALTTSMEGDGLVLAVKRIKEGNGVKLNGFMNGGEVPQ
jgi:cytochrome P450